MTKQEKLHKAVDLATNAGYCLYSHNGKPQCVIGQLGYLEDHDVTKWRGGVANIRLLREGGWLDGETINPFPGYPIELLKSLQNIWDNPYEGPTPKIKQYMHELIDNYQGDLNDQMGETCGAF
jgi:hypothetical protein